MTLFRKQFNVSQKTNKGHAGDRSVTSGDSERQKYTFYPDSFPVRASSASLSGAVTSYGRGTGRRTGGPTCTTRSSGRCGRGTTSGGPATRRRVSCRRVTGLFRFRPFLTPGPPGGYRESTRSRTVDVGRVKTFRRTEGLGIE